VTKIVINAEVNGSFNLSAEAVARYKTLKSITCKHFWYLGIARDCATLVQVVEELGTRANANYSRLKIVGVPDHIHWKIVRKDGREYVTERVQQLWG